MHPIYEYMVGDTVANVVEVYDNKIFSVSRHKFIIKECTQIYVGSKRVNEIDVWESHYKGFIKNLGNHLFDENELCTCRMVLIEKTLPIFCV